MKTLGWITTAALTIGLGIATPAMAREDDGRLDAGRTERIEQRDVRTERTVEVRHDVVVHDRPIIVNHDRFVRGPIIDVAPAPVIVTDCDEPIAIPDLTVSVIDTITLQGRGPIDSVQFVTTSGVQFYNVVVGRGGVHFDMHIGLGGTLLSLGAC
jgi:hypothetical protein